MNFNDFQRMKMNVSLNSHRFSVLNMKPGNTILSAIMQCPRSDSANHHSDLLKPDSVPFIAMPISAQMAPKNVAQKKQPVLAKWEPKEIGIFERTNVEGIPIASFKVWGEHRLCIPQLIRNVLSDFDFNTILSMCSNLQIYCSQSNAGQLRILHENGIIPEQATSCGLIRKSDAERLCKVLLHQEVMDDFIEGKQLPVNLADHPNRIEILHNCFGKQTGFFLPSLYTAEDSKCIHCTTCSQLLSPSTFVGHTHQNQEATKVTHWGFDSANWRLYIKINCESHETEDTVRLTKELDRQKNKFKKTTGGEGTDSPSKEASGKLNRQELSHTTSLTKASLPPPPKLFTAFADYPIPEKLKNKGPPILVNPESIVPFDQAVNYDKDFSPNVCLASLKGNASPMSKPLINGSIHNFPIKKESDHLGPFKRPYPFAENKVKKELSTKDCALAIQEKPSVDGGVRLQLLRNILFSNLDSDKIRQQLMQEFLQLTKCHEAEIQALLLKQKTKFEGQFNEMNRTQDLRIQKLQFEMAHSRAASHTATFQVKQKCDQLGRENADLHKQIKEAGCPDVLKTRAKYLSLKAELDEVVQERNAFREELHQQKEENFRIRKELQQRECNGNGLQNYRVQNRFQDEESEEEEVNESYSKIPKLITPDIDNDEVLSV